MNVTLITGATSGLGYNLACLYAKDNCNLLLVARRDEKLKEIKEELENKNIIVDYFKCDVSNIHELDELLSYIDEKNYTVNRLINNAGFGDQKSLIDMDMNTQLEMINTNSVAPFYLMKKIAKKMKDTGGSIINVASIAGLYPGPFMTTYHATKSFLVNLSLGAGYELKKYNINVLTLCPGPFLSNFTSVAHNDYTFKKIKPHTAEYVALAAYRSSKKKKQFVIVGFKNRLTYFVSRFVSMKFLVKSSSKNIVKGGK